MDDASTTVAELRALVRRFVDERQWSQFHTPKNLAMSVAIEAAELMEHFQWLTAEQSAAVAVDAGKRQAVGEELADVVCYALALANALDLDLADSVARKMLRNAEKYPTGEFQGRYGHDDPGPQATGGGN
ncbi:MAG: nucleotide pyrophosphohydrolase [Planctomycetia bacterium]|nr:nucleotide pyrophosphohydrolase [Planctomycetia bacterium]